MVWLTFAVLEETISGLIIKIPLIRTRTDQNTGGALLEFPMRTTMDEKSRVSSAISVCGNSQNFQNCFLHGGGSSVG